MHFSFVLVARFLRKRDDWRSARSASGPLQGVPLPEQRRSKPVRPKAEMGSGAKWAIPFAALERYLNEQGRTLCFGSMP